MAHTYTQLLFHIVFSTKGRVPFIGAAHRDRLYAYMGGIIRNERGLLLEVGGMPDHVHLLARFRASVSLSEMLKLIAAVRKYIQTQEQHHARRTSHEELVALLRKHRVEFNEEDLLD